MAAAILPAAGLSRRMGRPKLLLPFGETTIVGALVETLRAAEVDPIVVVTSEGNRQLRDWAAEAGLAVAINPEPDRGMLTSIWSGLDRLAELEENNAPGARRQEPLLILPADLPLLSTETVRVVLATARRHPEALVMPTFEGCNGHPLAIPRAYLAEIAALDPSVGLKQLRERHDLRTVKVGDPGVAADVDAPDEYDRLRPADP